MRLGNKNLLIGNHSKKSQQFEYKKVIMIKYSILTDEENVSNDMTT